MVDGVAFLFQLLRLHAEAHHVIALLEPADPFRQNAHHPLDHFREPLHTLRRGPEAEDLGAACRAVHHIHHVVQVGGQLMDILAVERRDEGAVEAIHHLVGHLVGLVLQPLQGLDVREAAVRGRLEQRPQVFRRFLVAVGHGDEQIEKLFFAR